MISDRAKNRPEVHDRVQGLKGFFAVAALILFGYCTVAKAEDFHEGAIIAEPIHTIVCKTGDAVEDILKTNKAKGYAASINRTMMLMVNNACREADLKLIGLKEIAEFEDLPVPQGKRTYYVWQVYVYGWGLEDGSYAPVKAVLYIVADTPLLPRGSDI